HTRRKCQIKKKRPLYSDYEIQWPSHSSLPALLLPFRMSFLYDRRYFLRVLSVNFSMPLNTLIKFLQTHRCFSQCIRRIGYARPDAVITHIKTDHLIRAGNYTGDFSEQIMVDKIIHLLKMPCNFFI